MIHINGRTQHLTRYSRMVLVFFVVSVLNMGFQLPAHAAMQQSVESQDRMAMDHSAMNHTNMGHTNMDHANMDHASMGHGVSVQPSATDCGCPPSLCESVEAQHDQLSPSSVNISSSDFDHFYPVLLIIQPDSLSGLSSLNYQNTNWRYRQVSPPPIQFTTELQI